MICGIRTTNSSFFVIQIIIWIYYILSCCQGLLEMSRTRTDCWTSWWTWESVWTTHTCLMVRCSQWWNNAETDLCGCSESHISNNVVPLRGQGWNRSRLRWGSISSKPVGNFAFWTACWLSFIRGLSTQLLLGAIWWLFRLTLTVATSLCCFQCVSLYEQCLTLWLSRLWVQGPPCPAVLSDDEDAGHYSGLHGTQRWTGGGWSQGFITDETSTHPPLSLTLQWVWKHRQFNNL